MEIRDPIHGSIHIEPEEVQVIEDPFFQRLRSIKQLGFSEYVFPGATHTRYIHSIGVMHVSSLAFNSLFKKYDLKNPEIKKLKQTLRLASLLHDIGHAPLSHSTESVMPMIKELKLPERFVNNADEQASHEHYTIKAITDSSFTQSFKGCIDSFGVHPMNIAELVVGETRDPAYFTFNGINYFPILHQLVSSEMDCDRMDYLLRDSYFCGVSYGNFDLDWIIDNLDICIIDEKAYLGISERAISTFDDFLISRFHMFLMVYFHYKAVCLEQMLFRYFKSAKEEYTIPSDIEQYRQHDDYYLTKILKNSSNQWAKRIIRNQVPQKILETFGDSDLHRLRTLEKFLKDNDIDYIKSSSRGRISKYYSDQARDLNDMTLKVISHNTLTKRPRSFKNIDEATDLFTRYSKSHSVNRIHLDLHDLPATFQKHIHNLIS